MSSQHSTSLHRPQLVSLVPPRSGGSQRNQTRPTLAAIRCHRNFDIHALAKRAGVASVVVTSMLDHRPVYSAQAHKVLDSLSLMHATHYDMRAIDIALFSDFEVQHLSSQRDRHGGN